MTEQAVSRRVSMCLEMAAKSSDETTRSYWLQMAEFWRKQEQATPPASSQTLAAAAEVVEL